MKTILAFALAFSLMLGTAHAGYVFVYAQESCKGKKEDCRKKKRKKLEKEAIRKAKTACTSKKKTYKEGSIKQVRWSCDVYTKNAGFGRKVVRCKYRGTCK